MPTQRNASTPSGRIPDPTIKDVFHWVQIMNDHIYRMDTDLLQLDKDIVPLAAGRFEEMLERVANLENLVQNQNHIFLNLVRRLQTIIDIREQKEVPHAKKSRTKKQTSS